MFGLRRHFLLDPSVTFLNHGSFGATPRPVFRAYQRWQLELERQPVEFLGRRFTALILAARQSLADYLGTDVDNLVYTTNVTEYLNIIAHSLSLGPVDEVLSTDHEYGSLDRTWRFLVKKKAAMRISISRSLFRIEIPLILWNGRKLIRVSVQGYNTRRDVEKLVEALGELLQMSD